MLTETSQSTPAKRIFLFHWRDGSMRVGYGVDYAAAFLTMPRGGLRVEDLEAWEELDGNGRRNHQE
jgi:hypothetical protein